MFIAVEYTTLDIQAGWHRPMIFSIVSKYLRASRILVYFLFPEVATVLIISPVSIYGIDYHLTLSGPTHNLFFGYLFLCPLAELQAEDPTCFRIPDCIAYWSLDPSGVGRLSDEAAADLGFPAIKLEMCLWGRKWDASVYNGICQFHKAKGFDLYSQEFALELGCALFQLSCDRGVLLDHSEPRNIVSILLSRFRSAGK
jgi:hypothetical protein